jgi:uncharacterized membrane protein YdjX (TVP38/TMEM64 family)
LQLNKKIIFFLFLFLIIIILGFNYDDVVSLEVIKQKYQDLQSLINVNPFFYYLIFFLIYIIVTAFALPIAVLMTLLAGALFGLWPGAILTSFASTIGSTLCFLLSRYLFKDYVQGKYQKYLGTINQGIKEEGLFYLLFLRLSPIFPFFVINLTFGLTHMKWTNFYWISQLGMLPATILFVNAGVQLGQINDVHDILTLPVIISFSALGLLPIITKRIYERFKRQH